MNGSPTRTKLRLGLVRHNRLAGSDGVTNEELDVLLEDERTTSVTRREIRWALADAYATKGKIEKAVSLLEEAPHMRFRARIEELQSERGRR